MLQRGVLILIVLFLNVIIVFGCPPNCWDDEEDECKAGCTDFTGASGSDLAEYGDMFDLTDSQINSMSPSQLSEFYNSLGMVTKYPDNFKEFCIEETCTSTQLAYVNNLPPDKQVEFWSEQVIKTKYTDEYKNYILTNPDFAADQIYIERSSGYTTTIDILEALPSPSIRTYPDVKEAMIDPKA